MQEIIRVTPTLMKQNLKWRLIVSIYSLNYVLICSNHFSWSDVNKFNKKLKDTTATEREKVILEVEVADQTAATDFFLNGQPIKPSERIEIKNLGGGKHQLIFNNIELTDQGEIKCKSGKLKSTCHLTVNKGESKPQINLDGPIEGPTGKMLVADIPYTGYYYFSTCQKEVHIVIP